MTQGDNSDNSEASGRTLDASPPVGKGREARTMSVHSEHSSYREKLLEHLFIGEVLRYLWCRGITDAEFLRPEVDDGGYDLVITHNTVMRHIQLKSSHVGSSTAIQKIHLRLAEKPSGCVVWLYFEPASLSLGPFLWFGGLPGKPLTDISAFPTAKHTKGNAQGLKALRPNIRLVNRRRFEKLNSISELMERLFGAGTLDRLESTALDDGRSVKIQEVTATC